MLQRNSNAKEWILRWIHFFPTLGILKKQRSIMMTVNLLSLWKTLWRSKWNVLSFDQIKYAHDFLKNETYLRDVKRQLSLLCSFSDSFSVPCRKKNTLNSLGSFSWNLILSLKKCILLYILLNQFNHYLRMFCSGKKWGYSSVTNFLIFPSPYHPHHYPSNIVVIICNCSL